MHDERDLEGDAEGISEAEEPKGLEQADPQAVGADGEADGERSAPVLPHVAASDSAVRGDQCGAGPCSEAGFRLPHGTNHWRWRAQVRSYSL